MGDKEFVEMALYKCPYCGSQSVERHMILSTIGGGHCCSDCVCSGCGKEWVSDNRIRINWRDIPERKEA